MTSISFTLNGLRREASGAGPHTTLLNWLRAEGLTGSKEGCAEGECGACAVLLRQPDGQGGSRYVPVNGCLLLMGSVEGQEVVTVEGLGTPEALHPAQAAMARAGGSQCGYCTPGFVVSMAAEYYREGRAGFDMHAIGGNLCRCTGYRAIRDAALALGTPQPGDPLQERLAVPAPEPHPFALEAGETRFYRAGTLSEVFDLLDASPDARLVAGGTDWVVDVNLRNGRAGVQIAIDRLPELRGLDWTSEYLEIGAGLPLSDIEGRLAGRVPLLAQLFPNFASILIRNRATLGGNLGTGSPIGDSLPVLLALGAEVRLISRAGERGVPLDAFFTGYRQSVRQPGELIRAVRIPLPLASTARFYKVAKRPSDDISSVAAAFALELQGGVVQSARIGLGGVGATPLRASRCEAALTGQPWDEGTLASARRLIAEDASPISDHRASAGYRAAMLPGLLEKFFWDTREVPV